MEIQRRALFNLLRMNWLLDPMVDAIEWQVEDYRALPLEQLFDRLEREDIRLDRSAFIAHAEPCESPEELTDDLLADREEDEGVLDRVYLVVFELWRRLIPEKMCLSIFCDELDHQISLYDQEKLQDLEPLENAIGQLQVILDENSDQGGDPHEIFQTVSEGCANDLEDFLYDYIADQIDNGHDVYAEELLDGFSQYVNDIRWFDLLRVRVLANRDVTEANLLLRQIVDSETDDHDLIFQLEVLTAMARGGERQIFLDLVAKTLPLIKRESDLQDLLAICLDYYQRLDYEQEETAIEEILRERSRRLKKETVDEGDPIFADLKKILHSRPI